MSAPPSGDSLEKFLAFQREVNRLFRRIFEEGSGGRSFDGDGVIARANVSEGVDRLVVEIETPGVPRDALSLWVSRGLIVVEGEKPAAISGERVRFHCMERDVGRFRRVLEIPCPVDTAGIRARYAAGILTITLPKIEDRRGERRKVPIEEPRDTKRAATPSGSRRRAASVGAASPQRRRRHG